MIRAKQGVAAFAAVDSVLFPSLKTGLVFIAGDAKISKDGANFANATNPPTEIQTSGCYAITVTASERDCEFFLLKVEKAGMQPVILSGFTSGNPSGTVVSNAGNTSLTFQTDRAETSTDYWKDAFLRFTSGALDGQTHKITAYNGSTKFVTFTTAFTTAPTAGDHFVIVND